MSIITKTPHMHRVEEFMRRAGQTVRDTPAMPTEEERIRIVKLIFEEAIEIAEALGVYISLTAVIDKIELTCALVEAELRYRATMAVDLVEAADGFADLHVVTTGGMLACGIADDSLQELIDESNLQKFDKPKCKECGREMLCQGAGDGMFTKGWWCDHGQIGVTTGHKDDSYLPIEAGPYRREDGKHIKPPYWNKPDVAGLLVRQSKAAEAEKSQGSINFNKESVMGSSISNVQSSPLSVLASASREADNSVPDFGPLYARRDSGATDEFARIYIRHVEAMTAEKLHEKSDIAAELAWRDLQIARLRRVIEAQVKGCKACGGHGGFSAFTGDGHAVITRDCDRCRELRAAIANEEK